MNRYRGVTYAPGFESLIMIEAISNNTFLAALLGPGAARAGGVGAGGDDAKDARQSKIQPDVDRVELSRAAQAANEQNPAEGFGQASELDDPEQQEVRKLKQQDAEVRRHEAAHKGAAGPHAKGGPKFEFEKGPDGKQYAVGGEVSIDTSEVAGDPAATIRKMQQVRRAALAPASPSAQDRAVAATAARLEQQARTEVADERRESGSQEAQSGAPYFGDEGFDEASRGLLLSLVA